MIRPLRTLDSIDVICSFTESNSPNVLSLFGTNLDDPIDCSNFPLRGYISLLIQEDSVTHMHSLAVYIKERLPFSWELTFSENSRF